MRDGSAWAVYLEVKSIINLFILIFTALMKTHSAVQTQQQRKCSFKSNCWQSQCCFRRAGVSRSRPRSVTSHPAAAQKQQYYQQQPNKAEKCPANDFTLFWRGWAQASENTFVLFNRARTGQEFISSACNNHGKVVSCWLFFECLDSRSSHFSLLHCWWSVTRKHEELQHSASSYNHLYTAHTSCWWYASQCWQSNTHLHLFTLLLSNITSTLEWKKTQEKPSLVEIFVVG